jgi:hypothetical protein
MSPSTATAAIIDKRKAVVDNVNRRPLLLRILDLLNEVITLFQENVDHDPVFPFGTNESNNGTD